MNDLSLKVLNSFLSTGIDSELVSTNEGNVARYAFEYSERSIADKAHSILKTIVSSSPVLSEAISGIGKEQKLRLVFSDEVTSRLADGSLKLMESKDINGVFKAIAVNDKNVIQEIGSVKWDEVVKGVNPTQMSMAMQGMAIQAQMKEISEQLCEISAAVESVLRGQHNDRLALYYAGEALFKEALASKDSGTKIQLTNMAIQMITESYVSLQLSLVENIKIICDAYNETKREFNIKSKKIDEHMYLINSSFEVIHKSMFLKAAIYYERCEYNSLAITLNAYKDFLGKTLTNKSTKALKAADKADKKIQGIWYERQNNLPEKINQLTQSMMVLPGYLEIPVALLNE